MFTFGLGKLYNTLMVDFLKGKVSMIPRVFKTVFILNWEEERR